MIDPTSIDFSKSAGLVPAIAQDAETGAVLMLAWQNEEAVTRTNATNYLWFYSRTRQTLWQKGETSGHVLRVVDCRLDCDADTLLYSVIPAGPTCHTGAATCFGEDPFNLHALDRLIRQRNEQPRVGSYTNKLLADIELTLSKVREESAEVIQAVEKNEGRAQVIWEGTDLIYHLLVLFATQGVGLSDIEAAIRKRHR